MRPVTLAAAAILLVAAPSRAAGPSSSASTGKGASPASPLQEGIKPAAERSIAGGPTQRPTGSGRAVTRDESGAGEPAIRGPKIPEALRKALQAKLDARVNADVARSRELRTEAIDLLNKFVAETPREAREMPEALVRLAELQWENERESFVTRFEAWDKRPVDQRGPAPELDYRVARDMLGRVIKDYPWFPDMDLALYVDGFLAFEQGKEDEARDRFERILREYPQSRFTPDAHMAKAEAIFNGHYDYNAALAEYEKVLAFKGKIDPALYGLALFKSAWCYWRLGNNDEAAKRFVGVFEATDTEGGGKKNVNAAQRKQLDELQEEALKYVVEVFTENEQNTAQDLYAFLTKIGGERFSGKIVRRLAEQYYDQAHYERGIEAYELLLKLEPTSRDAGKWILQIAAGYDQIEDWNRLKATFDRAIKEYTAGSPWARAQGDQANVAATTDAIGKQLRQDGIDLHAKAQKDRVSRAEFEGAASLYDEYLTKFSDQPKAYEIQFYVGEIDFFRLDKNLDAATHYMAAAQGIPPNETSGPLADMRHDALYNALVALSREMDVKKSAKQQGETEADKKYAEALDLYARFYPNDPQLPAMFYRQGQYYFQNGNYDSAVKIWGMLLEKFPNSKEAGDAGDSILESFNRAKNYENIETWARRLKALPSFGAQKQQERLDALIVQAVFKQGEQKAAAGDHPAAAAAYLRAAKEFPRDSRAAQACVNAEQEAKVAGDAKTLQEAAQLAMGPSYRDRPESPQGGWIATTTLQAMGLFAEAADIAEQMASLGDREHPNYAKFDHEKDAAYNAVVLRAATGENDRAVIDGNKFLAAYATAPEADEVVFQMGRAQQNAGRPKDAADLYKRYITRAKNLDHRAQGLVLLAQAQLKNGDTRGAETSLAEAVTLGKRNAKQLSADGKYAAAHARYMEGERVLAKFEQIQIAGDVKQLKARLKQKTELLKDAAKIFLDCVSMGVAEWTTAALYQIGHMYEAFGKALRDSPPPPEVKTDDQKADYQSQIEEFAVPMEERSLDAYENGWKKALDLGIYNQWTAKMRDALGRLNSELYAPFKETGFEVRSQGPLPMPALIDAPNRPVGSITPAPQVKK
ncbi:MAG TPA: tetratricopeptide repeat protein [Polyangiaceae bacterium]